MPSFILIHPAVWTQLPSPKGHSPGLIVLGDDPAPPKRGQQLPLLSDHVYCGQTVAHLTYRRALLVTS